MERVVNWNSFEEEERENRSLEYWLSRTPEQRLAESSVSGVGIISLWAGRRMDIHKDFADLCALLNAKIEPSSPCAREAGLQRK